jgi:hypothetical protein
MMKVYKGSNLTSFFTSAGRSDVRLTRVGEGGNAAAWTDIAESSHGSGDYVNQKPVARWVTPVSDVVDGNTYTIAVVAEHTDPNDSIQAVHFYTDDDQVNPKVATLVEHTSPTTGVTFQRYQYELDASMWGTRQEREVRAVIIPTNGTDRILQGSIAGIGQDTIPNPREVAGAPSVSNTQTRSAAGLHSIWLYKWDGVSRQIAADELESEMGSLANPIGVIFDITSDGDIATGLSSAPWTVDVGDQRDSMIKVRSSGGRHVIQHSASFDLSENAGIDTAECSMIWEGFEFDKTVRIGSTTNMVFVDCISDRKVNPLDSASEPKETPPNGESWIQYQAGPNAIDPYHAGEQWWQTSSGNELLLDASQCRSPGNTDSQLVKLGGTNGGVWYYECHFHHFESLVKKASACVGVLVEWSWKDSFSNTGCMIGCLSFESPYGFLAATGAQYHNDFLQFIGQNFQNVLYYRSGTWKRSFDSLGMQGQLIHISDASGNRAIQDFVMKDVAAIGTPVAGETIAQNMNMYVPIRNGKFENFTCVQGKLRNLDGSEREVFDKSSWNFDVCARAKKPIVPNGYWRACWFPHDEESEAETGSGYNTEFNYSNDVYYGDERSELVEFKNCLGDGFAMPFPKLGLATEVSTDRTLDDLYQENFDETASDILLVLFGLFDIKIVPSSGDSGIWFPLGLYIKGSDRTDVIQSPVGWSMGSLPPSGAGCPELITGMPDASDASYWT